MAESTRPIEVARTENGLQMKAEWKAKCEEWRAEREKRKGGRGFWSKLFCCGSSKASSVSAPAGPLQGSVTKDDTTKIGM